MKKKNALLPLQLHQLQINNFLVRIQILILLLLLHRLHEVVGEKVGLIGEANLQQLAGGGGGEEAGVRLEVARTAVALFLGEQDLDEGRHRNAVVVLVAAVVVTARVTRLMITFTFTLTFILVNQILGKGGHQGFVQLLHLEEHHRQAVTVDDFQEEGGEARIIGELISLISTFLILQFILLVNIRIVVIPLIPDDRLAGTLAILFVTAVAFFNIILGGDRNTVERLTVIILALILILILILILTWIASTQEKVFEVVRNQRHQNLIHRTIFRSVVGGHLARRILFFLLVNRLN
ncbi:hypothetical protein TYRP_002947 [Tyrophagus putrescentiae]|nr:hypothetical protein TYRP_002947 [Tyrophagus putrescentiae]